MLEFFVITSFWWWLVSGIFFIALIWGSLKENGIFLFFDILIYLVILQFIFGSPILKSIIDHPVKAFLYFVGYFAVGTIWSFFKWYLKVNKYVDKYNTAKKEYQESEVTIKWEDYRHKPRKPHAKTEKATISYWIGYWPVSVIVFFFEDFFTKIIETIMNMFQGIYTRIENRVYSKLD